MKSQTILALEGELSYQKEKYPNHSHSVAEWLIILDKLLNDAKEVWWDGSTRDKVLDEMRQIAATAIACLEEHGAPSRVSGKFAVASPPPWPTGILKDRVVKDMKANAGAWFAAMDLCRRYKISLHQAENVLEILTAEGILVKSSADREKNQSVDLYRDPFTRRSEKSVSSTEGVVQWST